MMYAVIAILTVVLNIHLICTQTEDIDIRCTEEYCKNLISETPCQELPADCRPGSETMNGIMMLEPSTCNCCDYCIPYLKEDDDCIFDGTGQPLLQAVCGPGLGCSNKTSTCVALDTNCLREQRDYDERRKNGDLGFTEMRPLCDESGKYLSPHCIGGSICYCVNPEGERIFGEKVFSSPSVLQTMTCECSLVAWRAEKLAKEMEIYSPPIHCLEDGGYDPLQCNESNWCTCLQTGSNIPDSDRVPEIDIKDKLNCFDPNIHQDGKYARECEEEALKIKQTIEDLLSEDIIPVGLRFPACQYDGRYSRVMVNDTWKFCVDPYGNTIEGYKLLRNDPSSVDMDCNCARTHFLLKSTNWTELPTCCDNGNFRRMQCRRGFCYCVDHNGNQVTKEVEEGRKNDLNCADTCSTSVNPQ